MLTLRNKLVINRYIQQIKQGDIPSAVFFCVILLVILLYVFENLDFGFSLGGQTFSDVDYADDIALITQTHDEMNIVLERLHRHSLTFGLEINISKTKVMFVGEHPPLASCNIDGSIIEKVKEFTYLGKVICDDGDDTKAVEKCISKAWHAYSKVKSILTDRKCSMTSKRKTVETYILPCLLYATETITWRYELLRKFEVFQNDIMRICTSKRRIDRIPIAQLRQKTGLTAIGALLKQRKLKWFGHIKRSTLPVKVAVEGMIPGKRKRGRPRRRWRDDIVDWTNLSWNEICGCCMDRSTWRNVISRIE